MYRKFNININDEDYLEFNKFYTIYSPYRDKKLDIFRIALCVLLVIGMICSLITNLASLSIYLLIGMIPYIAFLLLLLVFWNKILVFALKMRINNLKKVGNLPYAKESTMEFFDNKFTEKTSQTKTEVLYENIERVTVWKNSYIYIHVNTVGAYILPVSSFKDEDEKNEFLEFIKGKCEIVESFS